MLESARLRGPRVTCTQARQVHTRCYVLLVEQDGFDDAYISQDWSIFETYRWGNRGTGTCCKSKRSGLAREQQATVRSLGQSRVPLTVHPSSSRFCRNGGAFQGARCDGSAQYQRRQHCSKFRFVAFKCVIDDPSSLFSFSSLFLLKSYFAHTFAILSCLVVKSWHTVEILQLHLEGVS